MNTLDVTYSSGVTIEDNARLAGLALYYDKIWLPHPYVFDPSARKIASVKFDKLWDLEQEQERYLTWRDANKPLFDEGVLGVLPDCLPEGNMDIQELINNELGYPDRNWITYSELLGGQVTMALHHIFSKPQGERFFNAPKTDDADRLKLEITHRVLTYDMALVGGLDAARLLKLRDKLKPYRDGFRGVHIPSRQRCTKQAGERKVD